MNKRPRSKTPAKKAVTKKPAFSLSADAPELRALAAGEHGDPFALLGRHALGGREVFRCFLPRTRSAWLDDETRPMQRLPGTDLFEFQAEVGTLPPLYRVIREADHGGRQVFVDPYSFWPQLPPEALDVFHAGRHRHAWHLLGACRHVVNEVEGTLFSVWAPNAGRVSVIGDFNEWDGRCHPMRRHAAQGIWELFIPGVTESRYKFEMRNAATGALHVKADPYARAS